MFCLVYAGIMLSLFKRWLISESSPHGSYIGSTTQPLKGHVFVFTAHESEIESCSLLPESWQPYGLQPANLLCPWHSPGKNTGVGCRFLLQGIFPTQGLNWGLLHCRQIFYTSQRKCISLYISPEPGHKTSVSKQEIRKERRENSIYACVNLSHVCIVVGTYLNTPDYSLSC